MGKLLRPLSILFILTLIIEIAMFIQVGQWLGVGLTLALVIITTLTGVGLLRQQGVNFKLWSEINTQISQGQMPLPAILSALLLLFAALLLMVPGFVTDVTGLLLLIPITRRLIANQVLSRWLNNSNSTKDGVFRQYSHYQVHYKDRNESYEHEHHKKGTIIDGEFKDNSKE